MQPKNKIVYRFIESAIQPGDILLSTDRTSIKSWFIRTLTTSPYSHTAICYRPPEFFEAISSGVSRINVMRFFVEDLSCVKIRRLKTDHPESTEIAMCAAEEAAWYLGNAYWRLGALTSLVSANPRRKMNSMFCSHLVASAYKAAGVTLVEGKPLEKVTPADIAGSKILEDVEISILKPVNWNTAQTWGIPLENSLGITPHQIETKASLKVTSYVNSWLKKHGISEQQNFNQLLNFLRDYCPEKIRSEMDEIFCSGLKKSGYLEILAQRFPPDCLSFHWSIIVERRLVDGRVSEHEKQDARDYYNRMHTVLLQDLKDKYDLKQWYDNAWEYRRLETFRLLADNQRQMCKVGDKLLRDTEACLDLLKEDISPSEKRIQ